ncbi:esterase [Virgisporangium aliadipatigenens]|uniref:Esterase n=1 Tax=Virgisporangium aliadipatigenens TaxID=741659 RepID=A0A8J3YG50_9ACTN|nr:alpha/beta hydrolase [Virgisporangium aliadipatigenens]GIJ43445.1 esterase [Virgisporangium aliadipatigenens]
MTDILLIAGMWLDGAAWDAVVPELAALGHRPVPLTLPGQGDGAATATLDDQVAAIVAAVDASPERPLVVGHSAACTLAWLAADARPDGVARVALIGGFPNGDGKAYFDYFEPVDGAVRFPGWEPFEGPDSADLDASARARIEAAALPVPAGVTGGIVRLTDERRFDVPVTLVCPEFSPADARGWIEAGDVPELARAKHVDYVDIDSGHWPMYSKPAELARVLAAL